MSAEKTPYHNCHDFYHSRPEDFKMTSAYSTNQLMKFADSYAREYHAKEMERKLGDALSWAAGNYPTRDGKLCYNAARIEACGELLNHLKEQKQDKG